MGFCEIKRNSKAHLRKYLIIGFILLNFRWLNFSLVNLKKFTKMKIQKRYKILIYHFQWFIFCVLFLYFRAFILKNCTLPPRNALDASFKINHMDIPTVTVFSNRCHGLTQNDQVNKTWNDTWLMWHEKLAYRGNILHQYNICTCL